MAPGVKTKTPPASAGDAEAVGLGLSGGVDVAVSLSSVVGPGEGLTETGPPQPIKTMVSASSWAAARMAISPVWLAVGVFRSCFAAGIVADNHCGATAVAVARR